MTHMSRWWDHAVGYEIYIRSFCDGDGDGVGDFRGLTSRLDHLAWLGIDVVWITPFYPSPMDDWGYDVADYTAVHPLFGDLDAVDSCVARAHELGMKVIIDLVPNHTSEQHEWFVRAKSGPDDPFRDHYIWAAPAPDGGPPNNWVGYFGGTTWTLDEASGQYYLHLFLPSQPDLNWRNPAVVDAFDDVLRFWLDRGVDGFRIDVAQALVKDEQLRSNPQIGPCDDSMFRWDQWNAFEHEHDILQPETVEIYRRWNRIAAEYDALLLGETYDLHRLDKLDRLVSGGDALHVGFWFGAMHMDWSATSIKSTFETPIRSISAGLGWAQNSHDEHRSVTRFGRGDLGRRRALAFCVLLMGLPGMPFLYQGEELGLESSELRPEDKLDPIGEDGDAASGRDATRTPIPWEPIDGFGFTTGTPWLPFGGRSAADTVEVQREDPTSWLHRHRRLIAVRAELEEIAHAPFEWVEPDRSVVAFRRHDVLFAANISDQPIDLDLDCTVLYRSGDAPMDSLTLDPDEGIIGRLAPSTDA